MVFNRDITHEQVIKEVEEELRELDNKISVTSFSSSVNLCECEASAVRTINTTLQYFRRLKGWSYCSVVIENPDSLKQLYKGSTRS